MGCSTRYVSWSTRPRRRHRGGRLRWPPRGRVVRDPLDLGRIHHDAAPPTRSAYAAASGTVRTGAVRCTRVCRPATSVEARTGTTCAPSSASSQRIGRVNDRAGSRQRMFLAERRPVTTSARIAGERLAAGRPGSWRSTATYSTPSTLTRSSEPTSTPVATGRSQPRRRSATGGVESGGDARAAHDPGHGRLPAARRPRRSRRCGAAWRGRPPGRGRAGPPPGARSAPPRRCRARPRASAGGISSVPISKTSNEGTAGATPSATGSAGDGSDAAPRGNPAASRLAIHSLATALDSSRIRANSAARSAVDTAPRASRTLKAWRHLQHVPVRRHRQPGVQHPLCLAGVGSSRVRFAATSASSR